VAATAAAVATTAPTSWRSDIWNRPAERRLHPTIGTCRLNLAMYLYLQGSRTGGRELGRGNTLLAAPTEDGVTRVRPTDRGHGFARIAAVNSANMPSLLLAGGARAYVMYGRIKAPDEGCRKPTI